MTQREAKPRVKLTNADYMAMTPPENTGPRYQLINGDLIQMAGASDPHQVFLMWLCSGLLLQTEALSIGEIRIPPYDVHIDQFNTYQPDLLFVSNARRHIIENSGITGVPDVVVEILSESTRRHNLNRKLPVYINAGVPEVWVVDLDARTLSIYAGNATTPSTVLTAADILTSDVMPGVAVELESIFARVQAAP